MSAITDTSFDDLCEIAAQDLLPDISEFSNLDFFVSPPDLNWTMLQTHEDYAFGGPYFIEKDLLVPPTRRKV